MSAEQYQNMLLWGQVVIFIIAVISFIKNDK